MRKFLRGRLQGYGRAYRLNLKDTGWGMKLVVLVITGFFCGALASEYFGTKLIFFVGGVILGDMLLAGAACLFSHIGGRIWHRNIESFLYGIAGFLIFVCCCVYGSVGNEHMVSTFFAALIYFLLLLSGRFIWAWLVKRRHTLFSGIHFAAGCIVWCAFLAFLFGQGFSDRYISDYLEKNIYVTQAGEVAGFADYCAKGAYTPVCLTYGPDGGTDMTTGTVDLSPYVAKEKKWHRIYRSFFTKHTRKDAPIAGKIWFPKEAENCPVVFMAHGNHSITAESYLGYDYLGEYLASHGYVFVSVDENILNERSGENDARAVLLLENIGEILEKNGDESQPVYSKIDEDNIALMGHSRGGEMIADAYLFNEYDAYPSNGMFTFDYHYRIRALIAVAPSVNQYLPAGHETELSDVDYLVLQGANDQDISVFLGNEQYENVSFSKDGSHIASSLYIAGANHGQFNTEWGEYDIGRPFSLWLNVKNFITAEDQQEILKIASLVFLDKSLKGKDTYADFLTDYAKYAEYLPETLYVQQYETSDALFITDYEEDSDLETAPCGSVSAEHFTMWTEEELADSESAMGKRENHAVRLKWKDTKAAYYEIALDEPMAMGEGGICFDAMDLREKAENEPMDFSVVLTDIHGNRAVSTLCDSTILYPAFPVKLSKIQYITGKNEYKRQLQTIHITADQFTAENGFDQSQIRNVRFEFDRIENGAVNLDNIAFVNYDFLLFSEGTKAGTASCNLQAIKL